jgi:hypothetical protein
MEHMREIDVNGIKMLVDMRTAKKIDSYKIGDRVKVLINDRYASGNYASYHGVIVAFDNFVNKPAITICYIKTGYDAGVYFATITGDKDCTVEICPCYDDVIVNKEDIVGKINGQILSLQAQIDDLAAKRNYFEAHFATYFPMEAKGE